MAETLNWRTSTYTKTDNCVEVADNDPRTTIHIRDSKNRNVPAVATGRAAWSLFVGSLK